MSRLSSSEIQTQVNTRLIEELSHRQREFSTLIDLLEEIVFRCDRDGVIRLLNPSWQDKLGLSVDDSIGTSLIDYIAGEQLQQRVGSALRQRAPVTEQVKLRTKSGEDRSFVLRARLDADIWHGSLFDVTDQQLTLQALQDSEARAQKLSMVAETTDNIVIITDHQGRIDWVNAGFERETGYSLAEVIGRHPGEVLQGPETDPQTIATMRAAIAAGQSFAVEVINYDKQGSPYWVSIDCKPVHAANGEIESFIAIERNVTDRKAAEFALQTSRDEAQNLSKARTRFVANMSHEIRTPLNAILGMSELLGDTRLSDDQRSFLETIENSGKALLALVNDVLDFAKLESGQLPFEPVSCPTTQPIEEAVEIVAPTLREKGLELQMFAEGDVPEVVHCDPDRLRQVVLNLLSNAAKFTEAGGITIRYAWHGGEEGCLRVDVEDTGIGVDPGRIDSLFDEFTQADSTITREFGGTGLGLAICRQICEQTGGRIWANSRSGKGSCFSFEMRLQIDRAHQRTPESDALRYQALSPTAVAVVQSVPGLAAAPMPAADSTVAEKPSLSLVQNETRTRELALDALHGIWTPNRLLRLARKAGAGEPLASAESRASQPPPRACRVLIAEDVLPNQMVLRLMLRSLGCTEITVVDNGAQAVDAVRAAEFDLLLTDLHMPGMGGIDAAHEIQQLRLERPPLIVAVSADATREARAEAAQAGIQRWISKPVVREELRELLDSLNGPAADTP